MWSWRSKESKLFGFFLVSLVFFMPVLAHTRPEKKAERKAEKTSGKEENHLGATTDIGVTLSGITTYNDFLEIRTALLKTDGVDRVILEAEAPGLISMTVRYAGEARGLIESLSTFFPKKYKFTEKTLKTGSELNITKS